jgi:hypothetical protein
MPTKALLIKSEGTVTPFDLPDEQAHQVINHLVGGWFDCVRNYDNDEPTNQIVGYIHDEGLLIGLPINYVASALFARPLVGDCVIIGSLNEQGEYDGENHDLPEAFLTSDFARLAQEVHNDPKVREVVEREVANIDLNPKVVPMSDEQFEAWLLGKLSEADIYEQNGEDK